MSSSMFDVSFLQDRPIHVIGCGSLGGPIADNLYRKEVPELHLWDSDIVEARNRFNQRVYAEDIGVSKVLVRDRIMRAIYPTSKTNVVMHNERVGPDTELSGIVICAVDHIRTRYDEIWPSVFRQREQISFFADGRVGIDGGKAYGLDPSNENHVYHYVDDSLHNHPAPAIRPEELACKSDFPMPENADAVAAAVMWRLTRWLQLEQGSDDPYDNFIGWQLIPRYTLVSEQWDTGTVRVMHTLQADADASVPAAAD